MRFESVITKPQTEQGWIDRGLSLQESRNFKAAMEAYNNAISLDPQSFRAWGRLGDLYFGLQNYREAILAYKEATKLGTLPDLSWARWVLALEYSGSSDLALDLCISGLKKNPRNIELWRVYAVFLEKQGNVEKLILARRKIVRLRPKSANAWFKLGGALDRAGRPAEALYCWKIASKFGYGVFNQKLEYYALSGIIPAKTIWK